MLNFINHAQRFLGRVLGFAFSSIAMSWQNNRKFIFVGTFVKFVNQCCYTGRLFCVISFTILESYTGRLFCVISFTILESNFNGQTVLCKSDDVSECYVLLKLPS